MLNAVLDGREVLDVYSGVGAFTVPFARRAEAVISVELEESAWGVARSSIARLNIQNVTLLQGDAGHTLRAVLPGTVACPVIDPPRSGCTTPEVLRQVARIKAPRLMYVSCDPATFGA